MILHPSIIALFVSSILIASMVLYGSYYGIKIVKYWDIKSGSEVQLNLERRTYLISTILNYAFAFQLITLFLYIHTADNLCALFVGAMCAVGTLNVNAYGFPTLIMKILNFILAALWLILNYADNRAYDYPLVKKKYVLLIIIAPFILTEVILLTKYFLGLRPDVITSCCGALFSPDAKSPASELVALPRNAMEIAFFLSMGLAIISGLYFYAKEKGAYLFSIMSVVAFFVSIESIIAFISLYVYEIPTHHCPTCILQKEYGYIGYPLYFKLFGGVVAGMGVGELMPFRDIKSLKKIVPAIQKKLTLSAVILFLAFTTVVTYRILFSNLTLKGY